MMSHLSTFFLAVFFFVCVFVCGLCLCWFSFSKRRVGERRTMNFADVLEKMWSSLTLENLPYGFGLLVVLYFVKFTFDRIYDEFLFRNIRSLFVFVLFFFFILLNFNFFFSLVKTGGFLLLFLFSGIFTQFSLLEPCGICLLTGV